MDALRNLEAKAQGKDTERREMVSGERNRGICGMEKKKWVMVLRETEKCYPLLPRIYKSC